VFWSFQFGDINPMSRPHESFDEKLEAINRYSNGETSLTDAADYLMSVPTVWDWVKMKKKLRRYQTKKP